MADHVIVKDPIAEEVKPIPITFSGGKVLPDARQAEVGKVSNVRSNAVGVDTGDYEVVLVPAGTVVVGGEVVGKVRVPAPPEGSASHLSIRVAVSNAIPAPVATRED